MLVVLEGDGGLGGDTSSSSPSFSAACVSDLLCGTDSSMTNTVSCCCWEPPRGAESRCSNGVKGADVGESESGLPSGNGESEMEGEREPQMKHTCQYVMHRLLPTTAGPCNTHEGECQYTTCTHSTTVLCDIILGKTTTTSTHILQV